MRDAINNKHTYASLKNREIFFLHTQYFNMPLLSEGKRRNLAADMLLFYEPTLLRRKAKSAFKPTATRRTRKRAKSSNIQPRAALFEGEGAAGALIATFSYSGSYHSIAITLVTRAKICPSNFFVMPEPSSDTRYLSNISI